MPISSFYYYIQADQIISSIPSPSRVSRIHPLLSPNLLLFNSPSPATAQKPLPRIRHICGLGASVGCERVERTFNAPRLKAQIWLMKFTGFVCCLLNELNYINSLWRIVSYIRIVADTAAFRDSTFPFIGIFIL